MNIIKMRQMQRQGQIKTICDSIVLASDNGKKVVFENVVLATMSNIGLSRRTARDYVKVAFFRLGIEDGQKIINDGTSKRISREQKLQEGAQKRV